MTIAQSLHDVRKSMDAHVIGHEPVKEALLLGLLAHEHFYIEGEPGCAKTLLAEVAANATNLSFFFNQLHRDTRLSELIGDVVLRREDMGAGGEVIAQDIRKGGVLTAEIALLDDISRAPGEALNVLLRMLNERKYQTAKIPLVSAIATTNPTSDEYYNEPLDPANLDRFTLQLRTQGAIKVRKWDEAREIIDRYEGAASTREAPHPITGEMLREANRAIAAVELPPHVAGLYRDFLDALVNRFGCTPENSLLTDRTMLVKVPRMIKALALLEGRKRAVAGDLRVLKYILTFRVPEHVYNMLDEILQSLTEEMDNPELDQPGDEEMEGQQQGDQSAQQGQSDEKNAPGESDGDLVDELMEAMDSEESKSDEHKPMQLQAKPGEDSGGRYQYNAPQTVKNLDSLLGRINGRLEHNTAESEVHPGGSPRSWQRMRTFDEFMDTDPVETATWMDTISPRLPRVFRREKKHTGGEMVIVRDVSQSMEGRYARWTSSVVTKLVDVVRKKRMRIGYIEFNHVSRKYTHSGRFFTRDYDKIVEIASNVVCSGVTNYQFPMREALKEFRARGTHNKHIVFLTDGEPTQGDWLVREERRMAKTLNVAVHTLFIGTTECPEILDVISEETGGCQFLAVPDDQGGLFLAERKSRPRTEPARRGAAGPLPELKSPPGLKSWRQ